MLSIHLLLRQIQVWHTRAPTTMTSGVFGGSSATVVRGVLVKRSATIALDLTCVFHVGEFVVCVSHCGACCHTLLREGC